jgi:hypothetical protein
VHNDSLSDRLCGEFLPVSSRILPGYGVLDVGKHLPALAVVIESKS